MRVIEVQRHGGPEVLALAERPAPAPGPGQRLNSGGSVFVTRPTLAHHAADAAELHWQAGEVLDRVARGELSVRIGGRYPLADAGRAQQDLASRGTTGKLLLIP